MLDVYVLDELQRVADPEALAALVTTTAQAGGHLEIAVADTSYPMLDLLVRGELAVVHFFPSDGDVPVQASGNVEDAPEEVDFPSNATGEVITMPGSTTISLPAAVRCAVEFAETRQRPTSILWEEL